LATTVLRHNTLVLSGATTVGGGILALNGDVSTL